MKRIVLSLALPLLILTWGCNKDAEGPPSPTGEPSTGTYKISLSSDKSEALANEVIVVTAYVTKDNKPVNNESLQFSISGDYGYFLENQDTTIKVKIVDGNAAVQVSATQPTEITVIASISTVKEQLSLVFSEDIFRVDSVSPNRGSPKGGETVTIKGVGFHPDILVTFGGIRATVLSVNEEETEIQASTPSWTLTDETQDETVDVTVTRFAGTEQEESYTLTSGFTYERTVSVPEITGIDPVVGGDDTPLTIYGSGFVAPIQVLFRNTAGIDLAGQVQSVEENQIVVIPPDPGALSASHCTSPITIIVNNLTWGKTAEYCCFKYGEVPMITRYGPSEGSFEGGTEVILEGHGFEDQVAVSLAGVGAFVKSSSPTQVMVISSGVQPTSCQDIQGDIDLVNTNCGTAYKCAGCWIYRIPKLFISSISPLPVDPAGGFYNFSLFGSGMYPPIVITIGGAEVPVSWVSNNQVDVALPQASITLDTGDCVAADGCPGTWFVPTAFDITAKSELTQCEYTLAKYLVLNPDPSQVCQVEPPGCSFTYEQPTVPGPPFTVNFTDNSTGCVTSWAWDFNGDSIIDCSSPACTYDFGAPGLYTVTLQVGNSGGSSTCFQVVEVQ